MEFSGELESLKILFQQRVHALESSEALPLRGDSIFRWQPSFFSEKQALFNQG